MTTKNPTVTPFTPAPHSAARSRPPRRVCVIPFGKVHTGRSHVADDSVRHALSVKKSIKCFFPILSEAKHQFCYLNKSEIRNLQVFGKKKLFWKGKFRARIGPGWKVGSDRFSQDLGHIRHGSGLSQV